MKIVEEYYQDWYNNRIGGYMDLHIDFVDKDACDFAKYYVKQLSIHNVVRQDEQLVCECGRAEINKLSGICEICWNEMFPDEDY